MNDDFKYGKGVVYFDFLSWAINHSTIKARLLSIETRRFMLTYISVVRDYCIANYLQIEMCQKIEQTLKNPIHS